MIGLWEIMLIVLILMALFLPELLKMSRGDARFRLRLYAVMILLLLIIIFLVRTIFRMLTLIFVMAGLVVVLVFIALKALIRR
ncbi:MAG: hypothetical protein QXQ11_00950 [Candidatus Bathyarchaeia archaeon]